MTSTFLNLVGLQSGYPNAGQADANPTAAVAAIAIDVLVMSWLQVSIDRAQRRVDRFPMVGYAFALGTAQRFFLPRHVSDADTRSTLWGAAHHRAHSRWREVVPRVCVVAEAKPLDMVSEMLVNGTWIHRSLISSRGGAEKRSIW